MNMLKFVEYPSKEKVRSVLIKVYNLRIEDFFINEISPDYMVSFENFIDPRDSKVVVTTDSGAFTGFLSCYPPIGGGNALSLEDLFAEIETEGIIYNLDTEKVRKCYDRFVKGEVVENIVIAKGELPVNGVDAQIHVYFGTPEARPKIINGKSDFKNIENIVIVNKGDILLSKRHATLGTKGKNIRGEECGPIPGKDITILLGDGATVDEKGETYTATINGYVDYNGKKLTVSPLYEIKGNVDYSSGNVNFNGSVHVKGDVLPGFKIEADRHILIDGICQDCELIAGENVILRTGIKGSAGASIRSEGSVILGYCEQTYIQAKENIEIKKYAFNCNLLAGNRIEASSGEGIIAGGSARAFQEIFSKQLGTMGNSVFTVTLGSKYYIDLEIEKVRKEKIRIGETLLHVDIALGRFDLTQEKIKNHPKIIKMLELKNSLEGAIKEFNEKEEKLTVENKARSPRVKVKGKVFEGVTVSFFGAELTVKEKMENMVFYFDEDLGEITFLSLKNINNIELND